MKGGRGRAGRRAAQWQTSNDRDQDRIRKLVIASRNVRTMAVDSKHGVGKATGSLRVYREMDCGIVGLQEPRHSGQSAPFRALHVVYYSGESGGDEEGNYGKN